MIVIAGAGLAGLACALRLEEAGAEWMLLEASGLPGGRVAGERTPDGYVIDRGFQVLLESYPTARRLLDLKALGPRYFESGALLADSPEGKGSAPVRITPLRNPLRSPAFGATTLFSPFTLGERAALAFPFLLGLAGSEKEAGHSTEEELRRFGLAGGIRDRFLAPFFSGVFLEAGLGTDASVFRQDLRYFATGRALLPSEGMGEIPRQLVSRLPASRIRYGMRAVSLRSSSERVTGLVTDSGEEIPCDSLVLSTGEAATCALLGIPRRRSWKGLTTLYFTGDAPLYRERMLVLPSWRKGTAPDVLHFTDLTNIAPGYAPAGKRLLTATLLNMEGEEAVRAARKEIGAIFPGFSTWEFHSQVRIPEALPEESPGYRSRMAPLRPFRNVRLAGDQVARASIESALASGLEAADDFLITR